MKVNMYSHLLVHGQNEVSHSLLIKSQDSSALATALQKRRALWARHGETGERRGMQRTSHSSVQANGISSLSLAGESTPKGFYEIEKIITLWHATVWF